MANEATIRASLAISKGAIEYVSRPSQFTATVTGTHGPAPGAFLVTTAGIDVDLSEFTQPGLCRIQNLDSTNFVTYGIWDPESVLFYPFGELLAEESYILRLSRYLDQEIGTGTGTGTSGPDTNKWRFKADTASVVVLVEAFEV